jgi:hypothetical protein
MKIPKDAQIPEEKITEYLLVLRELDDKSKFLNKAGFTQENPKDLELAIRKHIQEFEANQDRSNKYGDFYTVQGDLEGTNGTFLQIVSVWLKRRIDQIFQFITLKPWKH